MKLASVVLAVAFTATTARAEVLALRVGAAATGEGGTDAATKGWGPLVEFEDTGHVSSTVRLGAFAAYTQYGDSYAGQEARDRIVEGGVRLHVAVLGKGVLGASVGAAWLDERVTGASTVPFGLSSHTGVAFLGGIHAGYGVPVGALVIEPLVELELGSFGYGAWRFSVGARYSL